METMSAEAKALHAVLAGDMKDADRLLGSFLPGELIELMEGCRCLVDRASLALAHLSLVREATAPAEESFESWDAEGGTFTDPHFADDAAPADDPVCECGHQHGVHIGLLGAKRLQCGLCRCDEFALPIPEPAEDASDG